jgi:hypothetical protein
MRTRKKPRFEKQGSAFIDPLNCGSTVQWIVQCTARGARSMTVILRDCDRKISWNADEYEGNFTRQALEKLHLAIQELQDCRDAVMEMERLHPRRKPKPKAKAKK